MLPLFRDRIYRAHDVELPPNHSRSNGARSTGAPLMVIFTDNKRFTAENRRGPRWTRPSLHSIVAAPKEG